MKKNECPKCKNELREGADPDFLYCDNCKKKIPKSKVPKKKHSKIRKPLTYLSLFLIIIFSFRACFNGDSKKPEEQSEISKDMDEMEGKTLLEISNLAKEKGYEVTYVRETDNFDATDIVKDFDEDMLKSYEITKISSISGNRVKILYTNDQGKQEMELKKKLEEKLNPAHAWQAVEAYGKDMYPQGFKLHYMVGKLAEKPTDENTWFLKAECTITNESGIEQKSNCEANVTGTTDNMQIIDFVIY